MTPFPAKIDGYDYGNPALPSSDVTLSELSGLQQSAQLTEVDINFLRLAGDVLQDQVKDVVAKWRAQIIASIPNLARHSHDLDGNPLPDYLAASNLRFEQWILDTCRRPYDQQWLDYQQEIALRHTCAKKNRTDCVRSTNHVPLRDIIAFVAVMNRTIRPFLCNHGHAEPVVEAMHKAWQKSLQIQIALWVKAYMNLPDHKQQW